MDEDENESRAMEKRLLNLERRQIRVGNDLRSLKKQAIQAFQSLWTAWEQLTPNPPYVTPPPPPPTPTFTACCGTISPGSMISFVDSVWGAGTLLYNFGTGFWEGWLSGLAYPGGGGCGAVTIAIFYQFDSTTPSLTLKWIITNATNCPVASTPLSTPAAGQSYSTITYVQGGLPAAGAFGIICNTTPERAIANLGTSAPEAKLYIGNPSESVSLTFAGTVASNGTSDFSNVCSCIPWTLTLNDSVYGNLTLTYDPINQWWRACVVQAYPGNINCPAVNIAVRYTLIGSHLANNWNLEVAWQLHTVAGHSCPLATTCGTSTFTATRTANANAGAGINCSTLNTFTFAANLTNPWGGTGAAVLTTTF